MKKIILMFWVVFLSILLVSCGKKEVSNAPKGNLTVVVASEKDSGLVSGASVTLLQGGGETKKTGEKGSVTFYNLPIGKYTFLVEKEGYSSVIEDATVSLEPANLADTAVATGEAIVIGLVESDFKVSGVAVVMIDGESRLVANAELFLTTSGSFVNNRFQTTTNSNGEFTFTDLPKTGVAYFISSEIINIDDRLYTGSITVAANNNLQATEKHAGFMSFSVYSSKTFNFISNIDEGISADKALVLNFSDQVDVNNVKTALKVTSTKGDEAYKLNWSNNNKTLTVKPLGSKWLGTISSITYTFFNELGQSITATKTTTISGLPIDDVKGIEVINKTTTSARIQWDEVIYPLANYSVNYQVYVLAPGATNYEYYSQTSLTTMNIIMDLTEPFKQYKVIVIARAIELSSSQTISSSFINAEPITIETNLDEMGYFRSGDYIYFGEYPQTIKEDSVTIYGTTDQRGYYLGSDGFYYAKVAASPFSNSYRFSNSIYVKEGNIYYFKVEPIKWRILSESYGEALILAENIIASKRYDESSNNYENSEVRAWLNAEFYNVAFKSLQRELILTTTVDNSIYSTGYQSNPYAGENTNDKLFLLSYNEIATISYGFTSNASREKITTDYTKANGVYTHIIAGSGNWLLRSPYNFYNNQVRFVKYDGGISDSSNVSYTDCGVVPALKINLN